MKAEPRATSYVYARLACDPVATRAAEVGVLTNSGAHPTRTRPHPGGGGREVRGRDDGGGRGRQDFVTVGAAEGCACGPQEGFRYHDLRHHFGSLIIASGPDVKVLQARLRHASAMTTLNTYGHMWPDSLAKQLGN